MSALGYMSALCGWVEVEEGGNEPLETDASVHGASQRGNPHPEGPLCKNLHIFHRQHAALLDPHTANPYTDSYPVSAEGNGYCM